MGNKTNPIGIRLLLRSNWEDAIYAKSRDYTEFLYLNHRVRNYLMVRYKRYGLIGVNIKQEGSSYLVLLEIDDTDLFYSVIYRNSKQICNELKEIFWTDSKVFVKQSECADYHPIVIASKIANDILSNNATIKSSVRQTAKSLVGFSIVGLKASYSGRIYGADIAQTVWHIEGRIPLHTFSADIRYTSVSIKTNYGICNLKVWICVDDITTKNS
ncbi:MAG: 30S ribosomal protein S3 [Candidatus Hodgkinia cicadicola]